MKTADYHALVAKTMDESTLQSNIISLARDMLPAWWTYHTHYSGRSTPGWPDLVLLRPPRLVFAELKRVGKKPTVEQDRVLGDLQQVADEIEALTTYCMLDHAHMTGRCPVCCRDTAQRRLVEVFVWTPTQLLSGEIAEVLR